MRTENNSKSFKTKLYSYRFAEQALEKVIKAAKISMQKSSFCNKKTLNFVRRIYVRERGRWYFIQDGGSLSVDEALQKVKEREETIINGRQ
jgi:hypothetical protein